MTNYTEKIAVAKITARQAILVAVITAITSLTVGYFTMKAQISPSSGTNITALETRIKILESDLKKSDAEVIQARNELDNLKQRVRDILGPKDDAIRRMSNSLERMRGDMGVSQDHRERLSEIVIQLDSIDNKVLGIVE
jgi:predicted RNase H-like nuclease (RuvC/YqgF family)